MLATISKGFVAILVVLVLIIATRPTDFAVSRSITISALPATIFSQVNTMQSWEAWSPWAKLDPNMKRGYEGPASGAGASHTWSGNKEVGEGRSTIVESRPNEAIKFKLEFQKPFVATNDVEFTFKPEGESTVVTWAMFGKNNFMAKAVGLFIDFEKMVGGQFEQGLANLKRVVQSKGHAGSE